MLVAVTTLLSANIPIFHGKPYQACPSLLFHRAIRRLIIKNRRRPRRARNQRAETRALNLIGARIRLPANIAATARLLRSRVDAIRAAWLWRRGGTGATDEHGAKNNEALHFFFWWNF